jgi:uncharacterized protein (DUF302 family)
MARAMQMSDDTLDQARAPSVVVEDISQKDFAETLRVVKEQLSEDGWNLINEINLGKRLEKKGVPIPGGLVILQLTSGKFARPLLKDDATRYISALMPCSISVYGMSDGRVVISRMNFGMLASMLEPKVANTMQQSSGKLNMTLERALAKLNN